MARVVILQPYVPSYRVPLFTELSRRLRADGHELVIASSGPSGAQADRRDEALMPEVSQVDLRTTRLRIGTAEVRLTRARRAWRDADVIIAELAAGATATYGALVQRRRPVGVWGHVDAFVAPDSRLTRALRRWQAKRSSHVLAYTDRGARTAIEWGVDRQSVTALQNTVDTTSLGQAVRREQERTTHDLRIELGLQDGPVIAMIGGIDSSKRIDLAVGALDLLWGARPDVQLVVGGHGESEHAFDEARNRGQVRMLGHVDDDVKAKIGRVALALLNPGRVGLIAVESMVLGLPIITTSGARHGPEFDYLSPGLDSLVVEPTAVSLADAVRSLIDDPQRTAALSDAIAAKAASFAMEDTVTRYVDAVNRLLTFAPPAAGHPKM